MSEEIQRFYATIAPFLFGEVELAQVERELGPSRSGAENLDFYRILIERNAGKILRELFPSVHALILREHPGLWPELVRDYARAHPSSARDPNRFGLAWSEFLAARRAAGAELSPVLEELADLQMCRYLAAVAPDEVEGEGFEQRVFVRGYTFAAPRIARLLARDAEAALPEPRATTVIVYRSLFGQRRVHTFEPSLEQLGALARRQGLTLAGPLAELSADALARGLEQLSSRGVIPSARPAPT